MAQVERELTFGLTVRWVPPEERATSLDEIVIAQDGGTSWAGTPTELRALITLLGRFYFSEMPRSGNRIRTDTGRHL